MYQWNGNGWNIYTYFDAVDADPEPAGWYDGNFNLVEPMINVGEAFYLYTTAHTCTRNFTVCSVTVCTAPVLSGAQITSDTFTFNISGPASSYWNISESSDLVNWTLVQGVTLDGSGNGLFSDGTISGVAHRFYKLSNGTCCSPAIGFERVTLGTSGLGYTPVANQLGRNVEHAGWIVQQPDDAGRDEPAGRHATPEAEHSRIQRADDLHVFIGELVAERQRDTGAGRRIDNEERVGQSAYGDVCGTGAGRAIDHVAGGRV